MKDEDVYKDRESQIAAIEKTFKGAKEPVCILKCSNFSLGFSGLDTSHIQFKVLYSMYMNKSTDKAINRMNCGVYINEATTKRHLLMHYIAVLFLYFLHCIF